MASAREPRALAMLAPRLGDARLGLLDVGAVGAAGPLEVAHLPEIALELAQVGLARELDDLLVAQHLEMRLDRVQAVNSAASCTR